MFFQPRLGVVGEDTFWISNPKCSIVYGAVTTLICFAREEIGECPKGLLVVAIASFAVPFSMYNRIAPFGDI